MARESRRCNPQLSKARDLSRSTLSVVAPVRKHIRKVKRYKHKLVRREMNMALNLARKTGCTCLPYCDHSIDWGCGQAYNCDLAECCPEMPECWCWVYCAGCEVIPEPTKLSRRSAQAGDFILDIKHTRWLHDNLSSLLSWLRSEVQTHHADVIRNKLAAFGESIAARHARFHAELWLDDKPPGVPADPIIHRKAFIRVLASRGLQFSVHPTALLSEIAEATLASGDVQALDEWSTAVLSDIVVRNGDVLKRPTLWLGSPTCALPQREGWSITSERLMRIKINGASDGYLFTPGQLLGGVPEEVIVDRAHRVLLGRHDVHSWADDITMIFDRLYGEGYLGTPMGHWYIAELVKAAIPVKLPYLDSRGRPAPVAILNNKELT